MKKIKSLAQLKSEKKRLKLDQAVLELRIRNGWDELKHDLKPVNLVKDTMNSVLNLSTANNILQGGFVKTAITYAITLIAGKLLKKIGSKTDKEFNKD